MEKPYTLLDHTADLRIRITGGNMAELFANAGLAMADLICDPNTLISDETLTIEIEGDDPADLMVNYLRELLYQWTGNEKLINTVDILNISDNALSARLHTTRYNADQHAILSEIKAVTYHQIAVEPVADGWQATVVLDT
ncbi:protein archease [Desulfosarcina ovata subsp. sediminis]|uniref:Protein archease n=1 Tax=Desulfosarcina ovata subsp. sediminis TaxID=885957 RepID=A0A5K7ZXE7_9BACT|nr:archease [Desulfosarcina ovata]BBO84854.1 protein archease [Desulfosarcina ovata subsp. sediminis]